MPTTAVPKEFGRDLFALFQYLRQAQELRMGVKQAVYHWTADPYRSKAR